MKIIDIFSKKGDSLNTDTRPRLRQLVDILKLGSIDKAVALLASKGKANNPIAIPYTPDAVFNDFTAIQLCMQENRLSDSELAALISIVLLKKHPKNIKKLLSESGYDVPSEDRVIYLSAYTSSILSLREFISIKAKSYRIISCGDQRVCPKCARQNGKKYSISKAIIGKTAPPFCEKCRCIMIAEF